MAKINSVSNTLTSQTGTGSFVGSNSPAMTGAVNYGGATTLEIINSASPTVSSQGEVAVDTSFTNFTGMMTYYDGSSQYYVPSIPIANLSTTNSDIVTYNSSNSEFEMTTPASTNGILVQYTNGSSTSLTSTTSTTLVDTSLTASITPISASSYIWIRCFVIAYTTAGASTTSSRGQLVVRRTTGTAADLSSSNLGFIADASGTPSMSIASYIDTWELAGDTSTHTYLLRIRTYDANSTFAVDGSTSGPLRMLICEVVI